MNITVTFLINNLKRNSQIFIMKSRKKKQRVLLQLRIGFAALGKNIISMKNIGTIFGLM